MEPSDSGKEIYELNCLHVGSLAAKVAQASLGLDFFNLAEEGADRTIDETYLNAGKGRLLGAWTDHGADHTLPYGRN